MNDLIKIDFLAGYRVLLVAHYVPGPMAAYLLRCLGAEVIKVEPPSRDMLRAFPPFVNGKNGQMSAWFRSLNAGFRSVNCDFKTEKGRQMLKDLVKVSDVLIDGNRPGYLTKVLGATPEEVSDKIIYVPISAHGQSGPFRDMAGHDNNVMAMAGNLSYTAPGQDGLPAPFSAPIADINSGYMAAFLAVAALLGRKNTESETPVRTIDASMLHAAFFLNQMQVAAMNVVPDPPQAGKAWMNGGMANYAPYATKDGKSVFFGPIEPGLFANFARAIDRDDLNDLLYSKNDQLKEELKQIFASKTAAEWEGLLEEVDCCCTVVCSLDEAMDHPQIKAMGLTQEVHDPKYGKLKLAGFPAGFGPEGKPPEVPKSAPEAGEDTEWVLREVLGYSNAGIAKFLKEC
jgi:crotonobetainyl-CoA:carnitine CoA-transferase CaiB-like acyl-CoA transferase